MKILGKEFFDRPVLDIAPELLGKILVRKICSKTLTLPLSLHQPPPRLRPARREREIWGIITEVEAYDGPDDRACHASKGCTNRTKVMFGPAGYWYVYLCYGMHWMLNVVCERGGYPAAVLIRGVKVPSPLGGGPGPSPLPSPRGRGEIVGPGKITKYFGIDKKFNGKPATQDSGLWIEDQGIVIPRNRIQRTPRVGVAYAGEWAKKSYRFIISPTLVSGQR